MISGGNRSLNGAMDGLRGILRKWLGRPGAEAAGGEALRVIDNDYSRHVSLRGPARAFQSGRCTGESFLESMIGKSSGQVTHQLWLRIRAPEPFHILRAEGPDDLSLPITHVSFLDYDNGAFTATKAAELSGDLLARAARGEAIGVRFVGNVEGMIIDVVLDAERAGLQIRGCAEMRGGHGLRAAG